MRNPAIHRRTQPVLCGLGVIAIDLVTKLAAQIDRGHGSGPVVPVHNPSFSLGLVHGLTEAGPNVKAMSVAD